MRRLRRAAPIVFALLTLATPQARAAQVNAVLEAEIVTLDPHFNSAYITRTFGYMVFDTLFPPDGHGEIKPQMVGAWSVSDDRLTWRFTLRDGLRFHDGEPVTAPDVVASLKRWGTRSALGGRLLTATVALEAADAKTVVLRLREPYGLMLETLGATVALVPPASGFMCAKDMPPLFDAFGRAATPEARRAVAARIQAIVYDQALAVPFGQFAQPAAYRTTLTGLIPSAIPLFWDVEKR